MIIQYSYKKNNFIRIYFLFIFGLTFLNLLTAQESKKNCLINAFPTNPKLQSKLEIFTQNYIQNHQTNALPRGKNTIPVVVHVVYPTEGENISNAQIFSQIEALNRDFNLKNKNLDRIHPDFKDRLGNVGFNFCLATIDPKGNPTNGITRTPTDADNIFIREEKNIYYTERGGKDAWNPTNYLNIWVTKLNQFTGGFASKPGENPQEEDGVVLNVNYFGQLETALPKFQQGRTGTHEVAHYFNIFHPWGKDCNHDDFVADTPAQSDDYQGCPAIDEKSCDSRDITANFMNNSEDDCLAMFTKGQALRMRAALMGARFGLLASKGCSQNDFPNPNPIIEVFPNPASYFFCIATGTFSEENIPYKIYNSQGKKIMEGLVTPNQIQHLPTIENGIYFMEFFEKKEERIVKKLVISN